MAAATFGDARMPPRFWAHVHIEPSGCWVWTAGMCRGAYGRYRLGGRGSRTTVAHRALWECLLGTIREGLQLDHLCRVRTCVNPAHLEPVTPRENTLRGCTPAAVNAAKTECPRGHAYSAENTYVCKLGIRMCRTCGRERMREKRGTPIERQKRT